jgi:Fe-S-cluster containining protein
MSDLIKKENYPYRFDPSACAICQGQCCTGESGYIYVTKIEIESIANFLELDVKDFMEKYLFKKGYKYSIKERKYNDSYECVFYDRTSNGCTIYKVSPTQCKTFPFWDYYKTRVQELKLECPGIIDV